AAPLVEAGTDAEYVAVSEDATLARVPDGLELVVAAALPTTGMTGLSLVEELKPLAGKTVLIVGAGGGVGSFASQFAVDAGARVIATVRSEMAQRLRGYGVAETVDHTRVSLADTVRHAHPEGIDALLDLASDADSFSALAALVRRGGTAVTTRYVADVEALKSAGVTGINFGLQASSVLLERVANALVSGQIVAPPITRIALDQVPALLSGANSVPADGKTVITL
ncbi:MAG: zinc-binding dehydrogenase, partial [Chloroflexi bacterium]|nr:zinc-binding dehydrogenase [Chloroflexota bacterium]